MAEAHQHQERAPLRLELHPVEPQDTSDLPSPTAPPSIHLYKRRWFIVILFASYSMTNAFQWIHLNIISNLITTYYNESLPENSYQRRLSIDWLSMLYMLAYIPLILPAAWVLEKRGLRTVAVLGSLLNTVGAWLKTAALDGTRFPVLVGAQAICATAQIFILATPPQIAAVWFGPDEVATATAIGVFGNQGGCAIGFFIPKLLVSPDDIHGGLKKMFIATGAVTFAQLLLVLVFFKEKPPLPPSTAQALAKEQEGDNTSYLASLKNLLTNRGFILLVISYGLNTGSYYGIGTLLNTIIMYKSHFPEENVNAGLIGFTLVASGVVGSIVAGIWLDKTKLFKGTTVGFYVASLVSMAGFSATLPSGHIWLVFIAAALLGFFMTGYLPVGFEFAAEITYPEPEFTSSGLLNASAQLFGIILTISMGALIEKVSPQWANGCILAALLIGTILTALVKADLRRQDAEKCKAALDDPEKRKRKKDNDVKSANPTEIYQPAKTMLDHNGDSLALTNAATATAVTPLIAHRV